MIKKLKRLLKENRGYHKKQISLLQELEWAQVYHDSTRGLPWLEKLPLNVGRWAGNYAFFYVLHRALYDYQPKKILEFGLGESSKFMSKYLEFYLKESKHIIIEHNPDWKASFISKFNLNQNSTVHICPLYSQNVKGFQVNSYKGIEKYTSDQYYDLYVVDGPFGSDRYSRYDIVNIARNFKKGQEFIIIFDDMNRSGEKETFKELRAVIEAKNIKVWRGKFAGSKEVQILVTQKYKFLNTI